MIPQLRSYTTYSLRKSINKPEDLINACKKHGYQTLAITERGNIFSYVKLYKLAAEAKIKLIIGCDLYIKNSYNNKLSTLTILAKNKKGFEDLLKIIAKSNTHENFNLSKEVATISLEDVASLTSGNFIVYSGVTGSWLSDTITTDYNGFIKTAKYDEAKALVSNEWKKNYDDGIAKLQE